MPAYNFQKRFAPRVEDGTINQTIRGIRKGKGQNAFKGCSLFLYVGQRRAIGCRLLKRVTCTEVLPIQLNYAEAIVNGRLFNSAERHDLAETDGFLDFSDMTNWFRKHHDLPFNGQIIKW